MIVFLNDRRIYNYRYRSELMLEAQKSDDIDSIGLFDDLSSWRKFFGYINNPIGVRFISSNIKTNLIFCLFFNVPGVVILNGLGRQRNNSIFRCFLLFLFWISRSSKKIAVQNYADYRYLTRFCLNKNLYWVPGSGGKARDYDPQNRNFFIISRNDKVQKNLDAGKTMLRELEVDELHVIGCDLDKNKSDLKNLIFHGYVKQESIFMFGSRFIQLPGYGEGLPHTLVDALVTGLEVFMERKHFIQFGLHKLGFSFVEIKEGFIKLKTNSEVASDKIGYSIINKKYLALL